MTVYAITDTKKGEQGLRLLIFKLPKNFTRFFHSYNIFQQSTQTSFVRNLFIAPFACDGNADAENIYYECRTNEAGEASHDRARSLYSSLVCLDFI